MSYPALENYLARLPAAPSTDARLWIGAEGRVQGQFLGSVLSSSFQPVRELDSVQIVGYEAFARSEDESDASIAALLDQATSDAESVALDRLCRMLHAMNFFRQPQAPSADLYLSVHGRLLGAVSGNHGMAFKRILDGLGLPVGTVVLQLPAVAAHQGWLLTYVADNYRMNGFRFAVTVDHPTEALQLMERVRPAVIKIDAEKIIDIDAAAALLAAAQSVASRVIFQHLQQARELALLRQLAKASGQVIHVQGQLLDAPRDSLASFVRPAVFGAAVIDPDQA